MSKVFTFIAVLLGHLAFAQHADAAADSCAADPPISSMQLCQDFRDIRNLIDANTLTYYVSSAYRSDENFRNAMNYIESDSFEHVSHQIANSAPYKVLLRMFRNAGVHTETIASLSNIFNCVMLKKAEYADALDDSDSSEMRSIVVPRALTDVATNLKNSIPKKELRSLIRKKLRDNGDFAKFYKVVRSKNFRSEAQKLFKSYQIKSSLNTLKRRNIDLQKLAQLIAEVLSWGP